MAQESDASSPSRFPSPRGWTDAQYEQWLRDVLGILEGYAEEAWPKGATRFGYFNSEISKAAYTKLDPEGAERMGAFEDPRRSSRDIGLSGALSSRPRDLPLSTVEAMEAPYREAHEAEASDDPHAIFEFARDNYYAPLAPWVARQLVAWRLEGTPGAKRKFDRFVRAYWSQQGKRSSRGTLEVIKRDQRIYSAYLRNSGPVDDLIRTLSDEEHIGTETIRQTIKRYRDHHRRWAAGETWPFIVTQGPHISLRSPGG